MVKRVVRLSKTSPLKAKLQPMTVRPMEELRKIRDECGSAYRAVLDGDLNADEYLALEREDSGNEEEDD